VARDDDTDVAFIHNSIQELHLNTNHQVVSVGGGGVKQTADTKAEGESNECQMNTKVHTTCKKRKARVKKTARKPPPTARNAEQ
jgi:hypothetical protein